MPQLAKLLAERGAEILAAWERAARLLHWPTPLGRPILGSHISAMLDGLTVAGVGSLQLPVRLDGSFDLAQIILEIETLRDCIKRVWRGEGDGAVSLREMSQFDHIVDTTISDAIQRHARAREPASPQSLAFGSAHAGQLVRDVLAAHEQVARRKGVRLRGVDELLGAELLCDPARIAQAFGSILANAINVCAAGDEILVRGVVGETQARFAISDPGPGLSKQDLAQVFEAASGLDLYVSKGIIDAHDGTLWVESSLGDGTTFFFTLPLAR